MLVPFILVVTVWPRLSRTARARTLRLLTPVGLPCGRAGRSRRTARCEMAPAGRDWVAAFGASITGEWSATGRSDLSPLGNARRPPDERIDWGSEVVVQFPGDRAAHMVSTRWATVVRIVEGAAARR